MYCGVDECGVVWCGVVFVCMYGCVDFVYIHARMCVSVYL